MAFRTSPPPGKTEIGILLLVSTLLHGHLFGLPTLNPENIAWMLHGDPAQHYLGWQFFRHEDWQWPLGKIAGLGLPNGTSIVFADAIPLLALLFKPFSSLLPEAFQYFGPWMWACFFLNGYFGLRLLARVTDHPALRLTGALFFIFSPPLFMRAYGHEALMAHWLLLAATEKYLDNAPPARWSPWVLLAALIHPYLLLMVLGLFAAGLFNNARTSHRTCLLRLAAHTGLLALALGILMGSAGYFSASGPLAGEGYGFFSMNLTALVEPVFIGPQFGTSPFVMHHAPATGGQYEGYLYLGAGILLLAPLALTLALGQIPSRPQALAPVASLWPLLVAAAGLWLLALSNQVTAGNRILFTLALPDSLFKLLSIFRASGRLGWPAFYLITLGILVTVIRKLPARAALVALLPALLLQISEYAPKYHEFRQALRQRSTWTSPLTNTRWHTLAAQSRQLVILPPHPKMEDLYLPFAHLAATHHLATNAAHTARSDTADGYGQQIAARLSQGDYDPTLLYVFPQEAGTAAIPVALKPHLLKLDGYYVLPPGLKAP